MFTPLVALVALLAISTPHAKKKTLVRQVALGVELIQEVTPEGAPGGPLVVTTLRIDPSVKGVRVEAALGGGTVWDSDSTLGREVPSKTVAQRKAVAGINASFFPFAGNPIGLHVENGEVVTEPALPRTAFVLMDDGTAQFPRFSYEGSVNGKPLHGFNRKPGKGSELLLFTPIFADKTLKTEGRVEVVIEGVTLPLKFGAELTGKVVSVSEGGQTPIPAGTVVLSGGGALGEWLKEWAKPGEVATLALKVTALDRTLDPAKIAQAVTGAGRLLAAGKFALDLPAEKLQPSFSTTRHPRTAVGATADGKLLFVTVDGRQATLSRGASLTELAGIMQAQGAVEAVNLDGGGSSSCVIRGAVANSPSEGVERPVADSLLVFADDPVLLPVPLMITSQEGALEVGETRRFTLPESVDPLGVVWTVEGGIGFVDQEGVFRAQRPGTGTLVLWHGGQSARIPLAVGKGTVVKAEPKLDRPGFVPQALFSADGATLPAARQVKLSSPTKRFESVVVRPS